MPTVFVHGVPEVPSIWDEVRAHTKGDTVALRLPGFGSPRAAHLRGKDDYAAWLADELRAIEGPIDLVGHDWGGHLALRVATASDVPIRSWVSDVVYGWHPDYVWHQIAQLWQTGDGEAAMAGARAAVPGSGGTFGDYLQPRGVSAALAGEIDATHDETMSAAILALYRSSTPNLHADWGREINGPASIPGLVITPAADPMADVAGDTEMAQRLGASHVVLDGLTHYWMVQDPARGAEVLQQFHATVPA